MRPRNQQVIRQWQIVRALEGARVGRTITEFANELGVCRRTILRDLQALEEVGFPLLSEPIDGRNENRWRMFSWRQEAPESTPAREAVA